MRSPCELAIQAYRERGFGFGDTSKRWERACAATWREIERYDFAAVRSIASLKVQSGSPLEHEVAVRLSLVPRPADPTAKAVHHVFSVGTYIADDQEHLNDFIEHQLRRFLGDGLWMLVEKRA